MANPLYSAYELAHLPQMRQSSAQHERRSHRQLPVVRHLAEPGQFGANRLDLRPLLDEIHDAAVADLAMSVLREAQQGLS